MLRIRALAPACGMSCRPEVSCFSKHILPEKGLFVKKMYSAAHYIQPLGRSAWVPTSSVFLRATASEYKLDPQRLAAFGQSAGGNLVALLGTSCGVEALEGSELRNADQPSCVRAIGVRRQRNDLSNVEHLASSSR